MQRLEVSCAVRRTYTSLGAEELNTVYWVLYVYEPWAGIAQSV